MDNTQACLLGASWLVRGREAWIGHFIYCSKRCGKAVQWPGIKFGATKEQDLGGSQSSHRPHVTPCRDEMSGLGRRYNPRGWAVEDDLDSDVSPCNYLCLLGKIVTSPFLLLWIRGRSKNTCLTKQLRGPARIIMPEWALQTAYTCWLLIFLALTFWLLAT